jgi:hypothetical protein
MLKERLLRGGQYLCLCVRENDGGGGFHCGVTPGQMISSIHSPLGYISAEGRETAEGRKTVEGRTKFILILK